MRPGGSYAAAEPEAAAEVMAAYRAAVEGAGARALHVTERPDPSRMPLLVDLDFWWEAFERRYDSEQVEDFLWRYVSCLVEVAGLPALETVWYVLETPAPRGGSGGKGRAAYYKEGLHLVCPGTVACAGLQRRVREAFLADEVNEGFFEALTTTTAGEAYDAAVLGTNNWLMYGSSKPEGDPHPWHATGRLRVSVDVAGVARALDWVRPAPETAGELTELLSV
jgi:hypothetical protein